LRILDVTQVHYFGSPSDFLELNKALPNVYIFQYPLREF